MANNNPWITDSGERAAEAGNPSQTQQPLASATTPMPNPFESNSNASSFTPQPTSDNFRFLTPPPGGEVKFTYATASQTQNSSFNNGNQILDPNVRTEAEEKRREELLNQLRNGEPFTEAVVEQINTSNASLENNLLEEIDQKLEAIEVEHEDKKFETTGSILFNTLNSNDNLEPEAEGIVVQDIEVQPIIKAPEEKGANLVSESAKFIITETTKGLGIIFEFFKNIFGGLTESFKPLFIKPLTKEQEEARKKAKEKEKEAKARRLQNVRGQETNIANLNALKNKLHAEESERYEIGGMDVATQNQMMSGESSSIRNSSFQDLRTIFHRAMVFLGKTNRERQAEQNKRNEKSSAIKTATGKSLRTNSQAQEGQSLTANAIVGAG